MNRVGLALAVAVVVLASACGGGGEEDLGRPPREYAASVCGAIASWMDQLQDRTEELRTDTQSLGSDLDRGRTLIVDYLDDVVAYSDTLVDDVTDAGKPDLDHGEAIAGEIRTGVERARTAFVDARTEAEALSTEDAEAFRREAQEIGETLERQGSAIQETLAGVSDRYGANELDQAFSNEEACRDLG